MRHFQLKKNQVLFKKHKSGNRLLVYFPGDVQMLQSEMLRNGDGVFVKYSYENCFEFLKKFKNHHIVIVRPDFHFQNTYSCFTSFLKGDRYGNVVEYTREGRGMNQLCSVLEELDECLGSGVELLKLPVVLVGFSKGAMVLNQLLYDMADGHEGVVQIREMHWLDAGNGSLEGCFPDCPKVVAYIIAHNILVRIHATPYQIASTKRPWLVRELEKFYKNLVSNNADVIYTKYNMDLPDTLENHFSILEKFT